LLRLYYDAHELKIFEGIESEWPLFYTYMILDGLFRYDSRQVQHYRSLLEPCLVPAVISQPRHSVSSTISADLTTPSRRVMLVPELYIVVRKIFVSFNICSNSIFLFTQPKNEIEAEKKEPGSVSRIPNENIPLVWAQSLYILGRLIQDGLLNPGK
jgi:phosphorylase kinase alpha/beta subunit